MLRACVDAGVIQRLAALAFALATLSVLAVAFVRFPIVGFWALELAVACLPAVVAVAGEGRAVSVGALFAAIVALAAIAALAFALAILSVLALAFVRFPIVGFWALELAVAVSPQW